MAGYGNKPDDGRTPPGTLGIGWGEALQELYGGGKEMLQTIGKKVQSIYQVDRGGVNLASEKKIPVMGRVKEGWSKTVFGGGAPLEDERNIRDDIAHFATGRHGSFPTGLPWSTKKY